MFDGLTQLLKSGAAAIRARDGGIGIRSGCRVFSISLIVATVLLGLPGCRKSDTDSNLKRYQLRGQVVRLDPEGRVALIKHQKIEGWMEAMTMEFPVKDRREFQALHVGDLITATVFVRDLDYWIGEIHRGETQAK